MAAFANTVTTVDVGSAGSNANREDLADVIYDISPMDTPFLTMAARTSATGVYHEWQTDTLADAALNQQVEGDEAAANTYNASTRLGNYLQISRKVIAVSGTQRKVDTAGRADEFSYQIAQRGREIKRDMEFALTRNQASSAGGATTARSLASLESWLATNKTSVGTGTAQATAGFSSGTVAAPVDSTVLGALTKATVDTVIQLCWAAGGDPKVIMVGPHNRTVISGFSGISTLQTDANANGDVTLMGAVDFYKSNFGTLKVCPNRFSRDETAFILDMEYVGVSFLRNMETEALSKTGDAEKSMLITEYTLEVRNELASGKVTDCATS